MKVLPAVLAFLPRYARCLRVGPTARHKGVVDHREGVAISPFGNNYNKMRSRMRGVLPGEGKGRIVQVAFAGKTSTSVAVPSPPVIIKPAQNMDGKVPFSFWEP